METALIPIGLGFFTYIVFYFSSLINVDDDPNSWTRSIKDATKTFLHLIGVWLLYGGLGVMQGIIEACSVTDPVCLKVNDTMAVLLNVSMWIAIIITFISVLLLLIVAVQRYTTDKAIKEGRL